MKKAEKITKDANLAEILKYPEAEKTPHQKPRTRNFVSVRDWSRTEPCSGSGLRFGAGLVQY